MRTAFERTRGKTGRNLAPVMMSLITQANQKDKYTDCSPLEYYEKGNSEQFLHPYTKKVLEKLLHMLAEKGEKRTFVYLKRVIRQKKKEHRL